MARDEDSSGDADIWTGSVVVGRTNKRVAAVRRLRGRREREETGLFWAEGIRVVLEAIETGAAVETLVVAPDLLRSRVAREAAAAAAAAGTPCLVVSADVFRSLSVKEGPQGLGAVVRQRWSRLDELIPDRRPATAATERPAPAALSATEPLFVALVAVQDPGNLGTIIRTCDAAGGWGVILVGDGADPYDPTAVRASMGSVFSQKLVRTGFPELRAWTRRGGLALVGTSGGAAVAYDDPSVAARYRGPVVLLMGSEREGLTAEQQAGCDIVVKIPMAGRADSLNLAVAAGIVLYEIRRRREPSGRE